MTTLRKLPSGICRFCGCTDYAACDGGCSWADADETLCTSCIALKDFSRDDVFAIAKALRLNSRDTAAERVLDVVEQLARLGFTIVRADP